MCMMIHLLDIQDRTTDTLHRVQQQSSIYCYMNDLKTSTGDSVDEFNYWLLGEKYYKLAGIDPKDICFTENEGKFLKFLYSDH